jgi:hypothetical protein
LHSCCKIGGRFAASPLQTTLIVVGFFFIHAPLPAKRRFIRFRVKASMDKRYS